jgi:hypothetical protein
MIRPGDWQAEKFSTKNFCPPSVPTCVKPPTLAAINPVDIPDALQQVSGSIGGPIIKDKTFFFATTDYTRQDRTTFLSSSLPAFLLPADGRLDYTGHYRQFLFDGRRHERAAPRLRMAPGWQFAPVDSRRLRHVLHADSIQCSRRLPGERAGRIDDLHRDSHGNWLPNLPDMRSGER